mmetsp:Transcript_4395/g.5069  ORF Transcript_4395/g.5069 Transcript_4395/m.5069 type:complete len:88 (-) Transcript_4395:121-384(-)
MSVTMAKGKTFGVAGLEEEEKYPGWAAPPQCTPELTPLDDNTADRRLPPPVWTEDELIKKIKLKNPPHAKMARECVRQNNFKLIMMF